MRLLGVLFVAVIMYVAVPLLWQHAVVSKVVSMEKGPPPVPVGNAIGPIDATQMVNQINPPVVIDTKKYEAIAVQSQVDEAIRRSEHAQDQAMHGYDPGRP
jgi:hypothetical protein